MTSLNLDRLTVGDLGAAVAHMRHLRGYSQRRLALACGASQSAISETEIGATEPRLTTLANIAEALGFVMTIRVEDRGDLAMAVLADLVDDEPCSLDHHGHCQAHGWLDEGECAVSRGRKLLGVKARGEA